MRASRQLSLLPPSVRRRPKAPLALEFRTHCAVADAMRAGMRPGWTWTHFPAGEKRPGHVDKKSGKWRSPAAERLKRMGLKPGWSDFLLVSPVGQLHCLELKRGDAPLTFEQEVFRKDMLAAGVPHVVARSFNEAIDAMTAWGAIKITVMT